MPALDGFRALAAFSVIVFHGGYGDWFDGVTFFFVLSGFLITTLLLRESNATGTVSLRSFYARRTLRIFPAYYACVVASYVIDQAAGNPWPSGLAPSAAVYGVNYFNAFNGHPSTSIAHLWSLAIEEQFYLLWPAVFLLLLRLGPQALRVGLVALVIGSLAWKLVLHYSIGVGQAYLYNAFDARFDNLAIGCLLATLVMTRPFLRFAIAIGRQAWMPLVTIAAMLLLRDLPTLHRHLFGFTLYSILVAILIVQLLQLHARPLWSWVDSRPLRYLGTISYPLYLYHTWALGLSAWLTMLPRAGRFWVGVAFAIAAASGSYYIVERPFLKLKRHFARSGQTRPEHPKKEPTIRLVAGR